LGTKSKQKQINKQIFSIFLIKKFIEILKIKL